MRFGVCYYPEQWPEARWVTDVAQMADIGFDLVRIGEFAWSSFEPARDRFAFGWLDRIIDTIAAHGMRVVMCTPTATPPVWLMTERPDILAVGPDGRRRAYGSRRHTCMTSTAYREESARIVERLLDRYGDRAEIAAWQVDNETGNHDSARCWCDECHETFRAWLERRFGTVDRLNDAWGTAFWSMTYPSFEAVRLPVPTMTDHHPALLLAHSRFASEQTIEFLAAQVTQIRETVDETVEITTNFYGEDTPVDQRAAARLNGVAAMDNYPHGPADPAITAYHLDLTRWAAGFDGSAWVMEQQPGPVNWTPLNPPVADGQVRLWTWQAMLHGVDTLIYFRWRAARHGQEMYHAALLRHDGTPAPVVDEIRGDVAPLPTADDRPGEPEATGPRLRSLSPAPTPRVGLLHSFEDVWAIDIVPHRRGMTHRSLQMPAYRAARRLGFDVAIIGHDDDLSPFELILAPALHLSTPDRTQAVTAALDAGTTVVLGPRSLVVDDEFAWSDQPLPTGLAERLGARVVESLSQTTDVSVYPWDTRAGVWTEVLELADGNADAPDAERVLAVYGGGTHLDGRIAAVRNGNLIYVGWSGVDSWLALLAQLTGRTPLSAGVEVFERTLVDGTPVRVSLDHNTIDVRIEPIG